MVAAVFDAALLALQPVPRESELDREPLHVAQRILGGPASGVWGEGFNAPYAHNELPPT